MKLHMKRIIERVEAGTTVEADIKRESGKDRLPTVPPGLVKMRRDLWERMKKLNKVGC